MSSTEPPSRMPPRQQPHEVKAMREELSSKGKVEKVREVDPDEETRKKKFLQYYKGLDEESPQEEKPSPFDMYSGKKMGSEQTPRPSPASSFTDIENGMIPSPSYSPPPNVNSSLEAEQEESGETSLPQSKEFWDGYGLPDEPVTTEQNFQETSGTSQNFKSISEEKKRALQEKGPISQHEKRSKEIKKKEEEVLLADMKKTKKEKQTLMAHDKLTKKEEMLSSNQDKKAKKGDEIPIARMPVEPGSEKTEGKDQRKKMSENPSLFGLPGKPNENSFRTNDSLALKGRKGEELKGASQHIERTLPPSPFEEPPSLPTSRSKEASTRITPTTKHKEKQKEESPFNPQEIAPAFIKSQEREEGEHSRNPNNKILEIEAPSLPQFPSSIEPMATVATAQASSYLNPATVALFYQMVGSMYIMGGTAGINRTEVILNNPAFANSKFYGSTITIEKYATAPDSFNIRLSGSQEAVTNFRENIPSLLTAFQNGNLPFRVGRLDVEYTLDRPVFRRKGKEEDRGESGGGELDKGRDQ